ncbi:lysoplasmalogenase [Nocardia callitridis]|uniref:Lysoplasmalogenase n=1 Tax=Nocardia callitridis TaxID=648753 RepID=A0ABP9JXF9_9NOCA
MRGLRVGYVVAAAATVFGAVTGRDRVQRVAKPLLMPLLAVDVLVEGGAMGRTDRGVLFGALAAATLGDVFLLDPDDDRRLVAGASSFAVMQTGYSVLWWRHGARATGPAAVPRVGGWLAAAGLLAARARPLSIPLTAYGATLAVAGTLAADPRLAPNSKTIAGISIPDKNPRSRLALGALLFTLSDGMIVLRRLFARREVTRHLTEALILATYATAQLALADPRAHAQPPSRS